MIIVISQQEKEAFARFIKQGFIDTFDIPEIYKAIKGQYEYPKGFDNIPEEEWERIINENGVK